ncbi:hypothetical protein RYX36_008175 [Vicia faba]
MEDMPRSPALVKKGLDEDQHSLLDEGSPKYTRLSGDAASGLLTPFLLLSTNLSSQIPRTFEDVVSEVMFHTYRATFLFSMAAAGRWDMLVIIELEYSLETEKKKHQEYFNVVNEGDNQMEEAQNTLNHEEEAHVEALKAHKDKVRFMKESFAETFSGDERLDLVSSLPLMSPCWLAKKIKRLDENAEKRIFQ